MRHRVRFLLVAILMLPGLVLAQQEAEEDPGQWLFDAAANNYFFSDDFFVVPVVKAKHDWLHLEARYNYEDFHTVSLFAGYNFSFGRKATFDITPMLGAATGNTKGVIPAVEVDFTIGKWNLYSESEVLISSGDKADSFGYTWTDFSFSPNDWLFVGISAQRTRLYKTELDLQRGLLAGATIGKFTVTTYAYNMAFAEPFFLVSANLEF